MKKKDKKRSNSNSTSLKDKVNRLDHKSAIVGTSRQLEITTVAPASTPLVSHEPIVFAVLGAIAHNGHGVVDLRTSRVYT